MSQILLIIPCYNEEHRLNLESFKTYFEKTEPNTVDFLFANDGSKDATSEKIRAFISKYNLQTQWHVFDNPVNTGKAGAIFNAYHWAKKSIPSKDPNNNTISFDFQK